MAAIFNTTSVPELEIKHPVAKCHLIDKLSNSNLILGRDMIHEPGIIFTFEHKSTTWQEVSTSLKSPDCTTNKFFIIKESRPV